VVATAPIGVAVFGVSTPFAYWGFHLVLEIVHAAAGETLHLHITNFSQLHDGVGERDGGSLVVTSDFPDQDLFDFLLRSVLPLIAFADDVDEMIDWTAHSRRMSAENAVRFCCNITCVLAPAYLAPRALILRPETSVRALVAAIIAHLCPDADESLASRLYEALVRDGKITPDGPANWRLNVEPSETGPSLTDPERTADMKTALASYAGLFSGHFPSEVVWPVSLFTCPDVAHWREPIDLTGPARAVMYGPYLHLPPGDWVARVEFEIDEALSGVEAGTDVFISEVLVEKVFLMPAKGIFAYELSFAVSDPRHAVEIRLFTKRSAIEGRLLVRTVTVRPGTPA
jgi:hypothetical protein